MLLMSLRQFNFATQFLHPSVFDCSQGIIRVLNFNESFFFLHYIINNKQLTNQTKSFKQEREISLY